MIQALRTNLFLAIPATAGLILLAGPITNLLFRHGAFTETDTLRTSQMVAAYACGIWAYSTLPVLIRGFYAAEDSQTPFRLGLTIVGFNGVIDLACIWLLGETGLAYASAGAAALLAMLLTRKANRQWKLFSDGRPQVQNKFWKNTLLITLLRSSLATATMYAGGYLLLRQMSIATPRSFMGDFFTVGVLLVCCVGIYLLVSLLLGAREWREHAS